MFEQLLWDAPNEEVRSQLRAIWSQVTDEIWKEANTNNQVKDSSTWIMMYTQLINEILSGKRLLGAVSLEEDVAEFDACTEHAERVWDDASRLYLAGSYPTAVFLAIVCLEEVGKLSVARFEIGLNQGVRDRGGAAAATSESQSSNKRRGAFYKHSKKHLLAAGAGAVINSRLDRLLGHSRIVDWLDEVKSDRVEVLRQHCIYTDRVDGALHVPYLAVSESEAKWYIVLAGEILAEVLGIEAKQYERLVEKVSGFERLIGLTDSGSAT